MLARDMVDKPRVRERVVRQTLEFMQQEMFGPELRADDQYVHDVDEKSEIAVRYFKACCR
jgi:hypothetical protein